MSKYIDADEITKWYSETHPVSAETLNNLAFLKEVVECMPTADVAPVKHGHWIDITNFEGRCGTKPADVFCSVCGYEDIYEKVSGYDYCPCCSARMDEVKK